MRKRRKTTLKSQIFFIMLVQLLFILTLVYVAFLFVLADDEIVTFTFVEIAAHIKRMLFYVLLLASAVAFALSYQLAKSIAEPIRQLGKVAEKISKMNFTTDYECIKNDSAEMEGLHHSLQNMEEVIRHYYYGRNTFLQNVSHEIRTPLMSIHGYAEAVREGIEDDVPEAMTIIMDESRRLSDMVEQLLTLSKADAFIGRPNQRPLPMGGEIANSIKALNGLALSRGITLSCEITAPDAVCRISGDALRIVLSNLISNSVRYAERLVRVTLSEDVDNAVLHIVDDGAGIPQERLNHLFERGYKGEDGNFGLGLHIVHAAIESVAGEISVSSTDEGTCFTVKIPKAGGIADCAIRPLEPYP